MRSKVKDMARKCLGIMRDEEYSPAKELGEKLGMPVSAVFRLVRYMRMENIGIHTTPKGYILSEFAKKPDDVHFMRRLHGRRASDFIAMRAAKPSIRKRWNGLEDRQNLKLILAPLTVDIKSISAGAQTLLTCSEKFPDLK